MKCNVTTGSPRSQDNRKLLTGRLRDTQPPLFEVAREIIQRDRLLRIGRDFTHENGALDRFLVAHDKNVGCSERTRGHHLLANALIPEAVIDGDACFSQLFEHRQNTATCFEPEVSKVHGAHARCAHLYACRTARFSMNSDHCRSVWTASKAAHQWVIATAEGDRDACTRFGVDGCYFIERVRPAISATEDLTIELIG